MAEAEEIVTRSSKATPIGPGEPVEEPAVTGRPQDTPLPNTTFAERAKARAKVVKSDDAEDKAVSSSRARKK